MLRSLSITDKQLDQVIGIILRIGVTISALAVLGGGILYLVQHGGSQPDYRIFHGESAELRSITGILKDASAFHAAGIIQLGLLLLIATPIMRVCFSIIGFALQRDTAYTLVTIIVLAFLLYSLTGGKVHFW